MNKGNTGGRSPETFEEQPGAFARRSAHDRPSKRRSLFGDRDRQTARRTVAIVGAGPGGLAAAMLLAHGGARVTLYEKAEEVGGRTKTFSENGFRFDWGPTFFLYPQILEGVFARCGLSLADYVTLRRVEPGYCLSFEHGPQVRASSDIDVLEREIAKLDARDAQSIRRFIEANRRKLAAFAPVLQRPFNSLLDYLAPKIVKALGEILPLSTVDQDLTRFFKDPRVRLAFSFQTKYLGMSPFRCPNLFTFLAFLEYEFGVWHPLGGCGAVSEGMAKAARELGVDIRLGEPVSQILFEGRRAVGVETEHGATNHDAVIVNADFAHAVPRLIPDRLRRRWSDKRIDAKQYSCSTFMLYLGIDGAYDLDHHTIFLAREYNRNIAEIEAGQAVPTEPSVYVANPGRTDPAFAANGGSSLYVLVPVGHCGAVDWSKEKQTFRNTVLQRLETLGLPGLRDRIRYERVFTPEDWRDQFAIYRGATFNLAHSLDQMLYFRPHNRFEDVDRVYLVGGGTHPGSGLPVIYESARITADLVMADLKMAPAPAPAQSGFAIPAVADGLQG